MKNVLKRVYQIYALLAQLVEHLTLNQGVQGSSPWRRTRGTGFVDMRAMGSVLLLSKNKSYTVIPKVIVLRSKYNSEVWKNVRWTFFGHVFEHYVRECPVLSLVERYVRDGTTSGGRLSGRIRALSASGRERGRK